MTDHTQPDENTDVEPTDAGGRGSAPEAPSPNVTFDLNAEAGRLRDATVWSERGLSTRTLLKHADLRLVLVALKSGEKIQPHKTERRASIQAFNGHVRLHLAADQTVDLPAGHVLVLDRGVLHDVVALEDSVILVTLGGDSDGPGTP